MNFEWISFGVKPSFYKEFYNRTILNFIHFKGYRQHSCFRQLYKTNYLVEWFAISHGWLWHMYQLREKILPVLLPSMVEAENLSDHPRIRHNDSDLISMLWISEGNKLWFPAKLCVIISSHASVNYGVQWLLLVDLINCQLISGNYGFGIK